MSTMTMRPPRLATRFISRKAASPWATPERANVLTICVECFGRERGLEHVTLHNPTGEAGPAEPSIRETAHPPGQVKAHTHIGIRCQLGLKSPGANANLKDAPCTGNVVKRPPNQTPPCS